MISQSDLQAQLNEFRALHQQAAATQAEASRVQRLMMRWCVDLAARNQALGHILVLVGEKQGLDATAMEKLIESGEIKAVQTLLELAEAIDPGMAADLDAVPRMIDTSEFRFPDGRPDR